MGLVRAAPGDPVESATGAVTAALPGAGRPGCWGRGAHHRTAGHSPVALHPPCERTPGGRPVLAGRHQLQEGDRPAAQGLAAGVAAASAQCSLACSAGADGQGRGQRGCPAGLCLPGALGKAQAWSCEPADVCWAHKACCAQGVIQVGLLFNQIAPITISFSIISLLEAAIRFHAPELPDHSARAGLARWAGAARISVGVHAGGLACCWWSALGLSSSPSFVRSPWASSSPGVLPCPQQATHEGCELLWNNKAHWPVGSYAPGTQEATKALLALREGWRGLRRFPLQDRAALAFSAGMMLPYSAPEATQRQVRAAPQAGLPAAPVRAMCMARRPHSRDPAEGLLHMTCTCRTRASFSVHGSESARSMQRCRRRGRRRGTRSRARPRRMARAGSGVGMASRRGSTSSACGRSACWRRSWSPCASPAWRSPCRPWPPSCWVRLCSPAGAHLSGGDARDRPWPPCRGRGAEAGGAVVSTQLLHQCESPPPAAALPVVL